jgi:hypothetical protein
MMVCEVEEGAVAAMQPRPMERAIGQHRAHVLLYKISRGIPQK